MELSWRCFRLGLSGLEVPSAHCARLDLPLECQKVELGNEHVSAWFTSLWQLVPYVHLQVDKVRSRHLRSGVLFPSEKNCGVSSLGAISCSVDSSAVLHTSAPPAT